MAVYVIMIRLSAFQNEEREKKNKQEQENKNKLVRIPYYHSRYYQTWHCADGIYKETLYSLHFYLHG